MASIRLAGLTWLTPAGQPLFSGLDLVFGQERTGLIGRNGVGKSTLLRLIAGERTPAAGSVHVDGTVYFLRQTVRPPTGQTIADLFKISDALAALRQAEAGQAEAGELAEVDWLIETRMQEALGRMGLDATADARLDRLSGGEQTRAALAAALFAAPDFLLLDEPTNNLDRAGRQAVVELLRGWRSGAIVVSHDRDLLAHVDAIVELSSLGATRYGGNWDLYRARKQSEADAAQHALAEADKQVAQARRKAQAALERQDRRDAAGARDGARGDLPRLLLGARRERAEASRGHGSRLSDRRLAEASDALAEARSKVEAFDKLRVVLPSTQLPAGRQVLRLDSVTMGHEVDRFRSMLANDCMPQKEPQPPNPSINVTWISTTICGYGKPLELNHALRSVQPVAAGKCSAHSYADHRFHMLQNGHDGTSWRLHDRSGRAAHAACG